MGKLVHSEKGKIGTLPTGTEARSPTPPKPAAAAAQPPLPTAAAPAAAAKPPPPVAPALASRGGGGRIPSVSSRRLTEKGGVTVGLDGDAGGHGPAEEGEQVHGDVGLEPVVVESLGLTARTGGCAERWREEELVFFFSG